MDLDYLGRGMWERIGMTPITVCVLGRLAGASHLTCLPLSSFPGTGQNLVLAAHQPEELAVRVTGELTWLAL